MYVETFQTPHPLKLAPDAIPQPLLSHVDPEAMSGALAIARGMGSELYVDTLADCADQIARATRQAMWYPKDGTAVINGKRVTPVPYPNLEHLKEEQAAGCYGFTIAASELMEQAQVPHWVMYLNSHAALLVPLGDGRVRYIDPLLPDLSYDATASMDAVSLSVAMGPGGAAKYAFHFNTLPLAEAHGVRWEEMADKHPWMATRRGKMGIGPSQDRDAKPVATVFPASTGRRVLEDHAAFLRAAYEGDSLAASAALTRLGDLFPEIDLRRRHTEIRRIARDLSADGHLALALASIDTYMSSIRSVTDDPRLDVLRGDCLRAIATTTGDGEVAAAAVGAYEKARDNAVHGAGYITMKIVKAQRVATACVHAA